jgi:hypothetical protein
VFDDIGGNADIAPSEALVIRKGFVLLARVDPDLE